MRLAEVDRGDARIGGDRRRHAVGEHGAVFAEGDVQAVAADPRVKAVYLGEDPAHG